MINKKISTELEEELIKRDLLLVCKEGSLPTIVGSRLKVEWEALGESILGGDYDSSNPNDEEVLRFYVSKAIEEDAYYEPVSDGSFCTCVLANTENEILIRFLLTIFDRYLECIEAGKSCKKTGEELSWLSSL